MGTETLEEQIKAEPDQVDPALKQLLSQEEIQKENEKQLALVLIDLKNYANPNCSKCFGRGHKGIANFYTPLICQCALKNKQKKYEEDQKAKLNSMETKIESPIIKQECIDEATIFKAENSKEELLLEAIKETITEIKEEVKC